MCEGLTSARLMLVTIFEVSCDFLREENRMHKWIKKRLFLGCIVLIGIGSGCEVKIPMIDEVRGKNHPNAQPTQPSITNETDATSAIIRKARDAEQKRQDAQWTSENIQKEPVLYLQSAIAECDKIAQRLDTQALSLGTKKNQSSREVTAQAAECIIYQKFLETAKIKYREMSASKAWPTVMNGVTLTEDQLKRKIVEAHQKTEACSTLGNVHQQNVIKLERKLAEIEQKQQEVIDLKRKLSLDMEVVKVKKAINDIDGIKDTVNAMMDISNAIVTGKGDPSLEDLAMPTVSAKVDSEFEKIMGK